MTTQYAIGSSVSGLTSLTAKMFAVGGDTVLYTADTVAERTSAKGEYLCTFGETAIIPAGKYSLMLFAASGSRVARNDVTFAGADGETATESTGDATAANQVAILAKLPTTGRAASAEAVWTYTSRTVTSGAATPIALPEVAGTIAGFPEQLRVGTARSEALGNAIHVFIRDENNSPVTSFGSKTFVDGDFSAEMSISQGSRNSLVSPTCVWVPGGGGEGYVRVSMTSDQSRRATEGAATMQLVFKWGTEEVVIATQDIEWLEKVARTLQ